MPEQNRDTAATIAEILPCHYSPLKTKSDYAPFVKWAGGKRQLLPTLRQYYPNELGKSITRYAEPFVGGGAVLFDILQTYTLKEIYISDINAELINTYITIRDNVDTLIDCLSRMKTDYLSKTETERNTTYYDRRSRYNDLKLGREKNSLEMAALFIFLNKTCFNGLYRVSPKTGFNVPVGKYKNPQILDADNLQKISSALQNVEIVCEDYRHSIDFIDENTFVYIDPPYRPLSKTARFTSYAVGEFTDEDQKQLAEFSKIIDTKHAKFLLSNSDPKNTNQNDSFFDDLYTSFNIRRIEAVRCINSKGTGRGKIRELLISNY